MFAFAIWDRERARAVPRARPLRHQAALLRRRRPRVRVRLGDQVDARARRAAAARRACAHLLEYFTFQNIFTDGTLFDGVQLLPPGHHLTVRRRRRAPCARSATGTSTSASRPTAPPSDAEYEEELDRLFRQAVQRQLVSDVPVGAHLSGGMDSGSITALAAAGAAVPEHVHGRLRHDVARRHGAGRRRARQGRGDVVPVQDRALRGRCSRRATWSAACRRWSGTSRTRASARATRTSTCARLASKFVKVALSGSGGDELFAGYPWRYYRAVVNDDFDDYVDEVLPLLAAARPERGAARLLPARRLARDLATCRRSTSSATQLPDQHAPESPEEYVNHSLLPRGEDVPARPVRRRGQAEHGAQPREPRAVPGQRPRRLRAARAGAAEAARPRPRRAARREPAEPEERALLRAHARRQAAAAAGDAALRPRARHQPGQAGLLGPGRELVPRRQHRLRPPGRPQ